MRSLLRSVALLLAVSAVACAAPADEDGGESADAVTLARGDLGPMVEKARLAADALGTAGYRPGAPSAIPLAGEIPSATFGGWKVAGVFAADQTFLGYMLVPRAKAPAGAFGLALVDPSSKVVAVSAYVPDRAPQAEKAAGAILDAIAKDGAALEPQAGSVTTKGIVDRVATEGVELAMRLLSGLSKGKGPSKTAARAEAFLAPKVESTVWRAFEAMIADRAAIGRKLAEIAAHRLSFGSRRVITVEVSEAGEQSGGRVLELLGKRYGSETKKVGLAMRDTGENAEALLWALRNDVPVVLSSMETAPSEAIMMTARAMQKGGDAGYARYVELVEAASDPKKLSLVRVISADKQSNVPLAHQEFAPLWTMSDEALGVSFAGRPASEFLEFFQRFELSTTARLP